MKADYGVISAPKSARMKTTLCMLVVSVYPLSIPFRMLVVCVYPLAATLCALSVTPCVHVVSVYTLAVSLCAFYLPDLARPSLSDWSL